MNKVENCKLKLSVLHLLVLIGEKMRQIPKKIISLLYLTCLVLSFIVITPAEACACGMLVASSSKTIAMKGERGVVVYDSAKGSEQLAIDFELDGSSSKSALVVPTPVRADISQIKKEVFTDLSTLLEPRPIPLGSFGIGASPNSMDTVQVLERKEVGSFEVAALKTNSFPDLLEWTKSNGFYLEPQAESPVRSYIENSFVLNVIKLKKKTKQSDINPLKFTFPANKLFYPLMEIKDSRDSEKDKSLQLYLLTDRPITDYNIKYDAREVNKEVMRQKLDDKIAKTDEKDFSNLDFTADRYYLTYINTSDYGSSNSLMLALGNPQMIDYPPLGLDYSVHSFPWTVAGSLIISAFLLGISAFLLVTRRKEILTEEKLLEN
jgi:hypothetical protein